MARVESVEGQFQPAKDLAAMITRTQTAEVDQMRRLLASA